MEYTVTWVIDVEAESPQDAARQALTAQRDEQSTALAFKVTPSGYGETVYVDLWEG